MEAIIEASLIGMIAGTVAGIVAVLAALPWKREAEPTVWFRIFTPLLIGSAFIVALLAKHGFPKQFFPKESWWSLLHVAVVATVIPAIGAALPKRWLIGTLLTIVATASAAALLLRTPTVIEQPWIWKAALGGAVVVSWVVLEPLARRHRGALVPLGLSIVFIALFVLVLGRMGFALATPGLPAVAAAMGVVTITAWIKPRIGIAFGAIMTIATLGAGTLVIAWMNAGHDISGTPHFAPVAIATSPVLLWIAEAPPMRKLPPWIRTGIAVALTAVVASGAVTIAMVMQEPDPYVGY